MTDEDNKWFYNPSTGEVTQGKESGWEDRMGPYDSSEEAHNAMKKVAERNKQAEAEESAEDNWGKPAQWES